MPDVSDRYDVIIAGGGPVGLTLALALTPFMPGIRLALVDRRGHVRGYYDGRRVDETGQPVNDLPRLKRKISELVRE